jgi:hypothetical protein
MPNFEINDVPDINVKDGVATLSFFFADAIGNEETDKRFINYVEGLLDGDKYAEECSLTINVPLLSLLNDEVVGRCHYGSNDESASAHIDEKPHFDKIKADLLALVAKIDMIEFCADEPDSAATV